MIQVVEINRVDELSPLRLVWDSLLTRSPQASFFLTLDWLQAYWMHFGRGQKLRVLLVYAGKKPIGIVPLTVTRERTRAGSLRVLTYPLHDWGSFYGPIGPHPTATLTAAIRHIRQTTRDWDLFDLRWVDSEAYDRGRTYNAMKLAGYVPHERVWKSIAIVDTGGTWDDYLAGRSAKSRETVRWSLNRVHRLGQVRHIRYRPRGAIYGEDDPRWDLYDECVRLAQRSWQGHSATGTTLSTASVGAFFRATHELAAKHGALDLNLLLLDNRPVSFCYNYHFQGHIYGVRTAYDPDYAQASVGQVLKAMQIKDSILRGDRCIDLGSGYLDAKRAWSTRIVNSYRYTHYPSNVKAQLLRVKHWLTANTRNSCKEIPALTRKF